VPYAITATKALAYTVALASLSCSALVATDPSAAAPMARRCSAFDKVESQEIQGHRTVFHDRVYAIQVQGAVCATAKSQILQTSRALATRGKGLGVFIRVGAWSCTSFRPFMGGAHFIHWDSECRQPHGHHLSWSERTLSSHRLT
jgi:hypothetical protein